jgi:hypothetical protein
MVHASRRSPELEFRRAKLKTMTARVRSTRPLVHEMPQFTIAQLKQWGLLRVGQTNRHAYSDEISLVTTLAGRRTALKIRGQKLEFVIALVSRPLGKGLVWYFCDPVSGRLVKSLYYSKEGWLYGQKAAGALYASQFQSKCYRQLLRMDKLILAIDGGRNGRVGPARGASRLRKLQDLCRIFSEVRAADREREAALGKFPQLYYTIRSANLILKRERGKLHKSWMPSRQVKASWHSSTSGLDLIP